MKKRKVTALVRKRIRTVTMAALVCALALPTVATFSNLYTNAEDSTIIPAPVKVYNFDDPDVPDEVTYPGEENDPSVENDTERGKVLMLKDTTEEVVQEEGQDGEGNPTTVDKTVYTYSQASIANPFKGNTDLIEEIGFTSQGIPLWENGVTISYWQKAATEDSSVITFNNIREGVMHKDDRTKNLLLQKFEANPEDPLFNPGTTSTVTFDGNTVKSLKYKGVSVIAGDIGPQPNTEYTIREGFGMFVRFHPDYKSGGYYLEKVYEKGVLTSYKLKTMGKEAVSMSGYSSDLMAPGSMVRYQTEKSSLQFDASGSWGYAEGEETEWLTRGEPAGPTEKGRLNQGNQAAAFSYVLKKGSDNKEYREYQSASVINTPATWHYITLVVKNDSISTYIDGVLKDEQLYTDKSNLEAVDANKGFNLGWGYYTSGSDAGIINRKEGDAIHTNADSIAVAEDGNYSMGNLALGYNGNTVSMTILEMLTDAGTDLLLGGSGYAQNLWNKTVTTTVDSVQVKTITDKGINVGTAEGTCLDSIAFFDEPLTGDQVAALYEYVQDQELKTGEVPVRNTTTPNPSATPGPTIDPSADPSATPGPTVGPSTTPGGKGDVNGDGEVKLNDAQMALRAALNIVDLSSREFTAADVDGNGEVKLNDAQMILRAALNIITL